mmetsp:Transcript_4779/g.11367  ORF Transcript_4779/g.11367 Transcript_4779/m.11367 type:complete len:208 (-) Transcript_4779:153-776(-)
MMMMLLLLLVDTNRVCSNQPPFRTSSGLPFVPVFWISRRQRDRVVVVVVVVVSRKREDDPDGFQHVFRNRRRRQDVVQDAPHKARLAGKGHHGDLQSAGQCRRDQLGVDGTDVREEFLQRSLPVPAGVDVQYGLVEVQCQKIDPDGVFQVVDDLLDGRGIGVAAAAAAAACCGAAADACSGRRRSRFRRRQRRRHGCASSHFRCCCR